MSASTLHQEVTARIIAEMEAGIIPWQKPWKTPLQIPLNLSSKRRYRGINIFILWAACQEHGYSSHQWVTFKQASDLGGTIKKGSKATHVIHYTLLEKTTTTGETEQFPSIRRYAVFNIDQTEGLAPQPILHLAMSDVIDFVESLELTVHTAPIAAYNPRTDVLSMPPFESFITEEDYWCTYLHEIGHWTGPRLERTPNIEDKREYAFEELIAELSSAFLCAHFSIDPKVRHADYIGHWLTLLKDDPRAYFRAASKASQVFEYLIGVDHGQPGLQGDQGESSDQGAHGEVPSGPRWRLGRVPVLRDQQILSFDA